MKKEKRNEEALSLFHEYTFLYFPPVLDSDQQNRLGDESSIFCGGFTRQRVRPGTRRNLKFDIERALRKTECLMRIRHLKVMGVGGH